MSILDSRIYYINSENRIAGTASNFTYEIRIPDNMKVDSCLVLSMTIPKSFYVVRRLLNMVTVLVDGIPNVITVPPGNYGANNFQPVLLALLKGLNVGTFAMSVNVITGKFTYTYVGSSTIQFQFFTPSRLGHQMGFDCPSTNAFVGGTLTSTNVLDFVSTSTVFLHSDMINDSTGVLQEVYSDNTVPFSNIVYNCKYPFYTKRMSKPTSGVFNFSITDEDNQEINLNGHDICVTLMLYRKENITGLIQSIFPRAQ